MAFSGVKKWRKASIHKAQYKICNQLCKQAQRRAAAETAAFIGVRYNDESSFNLDNDFAIDPVSTKT